MTPIQAITFGAVQGITEFLPISSTAHLILLPAVMHWPDPGLTYDVALHIGTLLAVLIYFAGDLGRLTRAWFQSLVKRDPNDPYQRLAWLIIAGTVPAAVIGVLCEKWVETTLRSPLLIGFNLILVATVILIVDRRANNDGRSWKELNLGDAMAIGFGQAAALIPGFSRSGSTMCVGLLRGLERSAAARISFLLGTPIIFGSAIFKLRHLSHQALPADERSAFIIGIVTSGVVGYACIHFLLGYLSRKPLAVFMVYRIIVGGLVIGLSLAGFLQPPAAVKTARSHSAPHVIAHR
ncbi:MAG: undecaprenyl-diphosphatase UppP [Candidatus Sericytochromatia bacterium]|nr:undecaprenyl-diphosphatase UppP [Candidatus Sericytochromatia bacterium]